LLLRGSRDGFTYKKFHEICDNQSRTVTIIKVKVSKEILGGYNPIEWKSDDSYGTTKDSFIFSFKRCNDIKSYILSRIKNEKVAILNSFDRGSLFGISDFVLDGDLVNVVILLTKNKLVKLLIYFLIYFLWKNMKYFKLQDKSHLQLSIFVFNISKRYHMKLSLYNVDYYIRFK
jgi:hypothetical protein